MILDAICNERRTPRAIAYMLINHFTTFRNGDIENLEVLYGDITEIVNHIFDRTELEMLVSRGVLKARTRDEIINTDIQSWFDNLGKLMEYNDIDCITPEDSIYPDRLRLINKAPLALYYKGDISLLSSEHSIAVVGSRRPTYYGLNQAEQFSRELSGRGITIISGMAYGIDSRAHETTIRSGGKTVAVLGGGVDICYPRTNMEIYHEMCKNQLVLSEYEPGTAHTSLHFPMRNRIISGLSDGVLLVEAAFRSGTLITADYALEQGKNIYGIPGRPSDVMSKGVNSIIKQGAMLVDSPSDIIMDFFQNDFKSSDRKNISRKTNLKENNSLSVKEKEIISILGYEPLYIDEIIRHNNMKVADTIQILTGLEQKGKIKCVEKGYYILC